MWPCSVFCCRSGENGLSVLELFVLELLIREIKLHSLWKVGGCSSCSSVFLQLLFHIALPSYTRLCHLDVSVVTTFLVQAVGSISKARDGPVSWDSCRPGSPVSSSVLIILSLGAASRKEQSSMELSVRSREQDPPPNECLSLKQARVFKIGSLVSVLNSLSQDFTRACVALN